MTRTKTLLTIGCLLAVLVTGNLLWPMMNAEAQAPKARQQWEYATLSSEHGDRHASATWSTGKKTLHATWEAGKDQPLPLSKLNKDLGGKEKDAHEGVLLDRIGQDGWELVCHTRTEGRPRDIQTWTFKRPAQ